MRETCSVCGKKAGLIFKGMTKVGGVNYCEICYLKNLETFPVQPIPQSWICKNGFHPKTRRLSVSELLIYEGDIFTKLHILLGTSHRVGSFVDYTFYGIDCGNGQLMKVIYDTDWEYPKGTDICYLRPEELKAAAHRLQGPDFCVFDDLTEANTAEYLSICYPADDLLECHMGMQVFGDIAKIAYQSPNGVFYAETSVPVFEKWRNGKSAADCVFTREALMTDAIRCYRLPFARDAVVGRLLNKLIKVGTPVEDAEANIFLHYFADNKLHRLRVSPEEAEQYFTSFLALYKVTL